MTADRARKAAIRARMAATGEPYTVAARQAMAAWQVAAAQLRSDLASRQRVTARVPGPYELLERSRSAQRAALLALWQDYSRLATGRRAPLT